jgi:hypothetical protein
MSDRAVREIRVWLYVCCGAIVAAVAGFWWDHNERADVEICKSMRNLGFASGSPSLSDLTGSCERTNYTGLIVLAVAGVALLVGVVGVALARARTDA